MHWQDRRNCSRDPNVFKQFPVQSGAITDDTLPECGHCRGQLGNSTKAIIPPGLKWQITIDTDFEEGSAHVLELDQIPISVRVVAARDRERARPGWWCLHVKGLANPQL